METTNSKLVDAVFSCDLESIKRYIQKPFNPYVFECNDFPIYYLTMCQKIIFDSGFTDSVKFLIERWRKKTNEILNYWKTEFHFPVDEKIPFNKYPDLLRCCDADDSFEDCLWDTAENSIRRSNCTMQDLKLYEAVQKLNFEAAAILLESGARPDIPIIFDDGEHFSCIDSVSVECGFMCSEVLFAFEDTKWINNVAYSSLFEYLFNWAAYESMYALLDKYIK